jgi:rare lipoprotein A
MDLITRYPAYIVFIILFFYGCSSTSRYSGSNDNSESNIRYKSSDVLETETGTASFYANEFNGKKTANGEVYDMNGLTAAHPSFPYNTVVKVTNLDNGKSIEVRINDRMPNFKGRIIDLSFAAARKIEMINAGVQKVKLEVLRWGK